VTSYLLPEGKQSFTSNAGLPLVGGKVFTYAAGTSSFKTTWSDAAQTAANTNPVILDGRGEATIFWDGAYKVALTDSADVTIWTVDAVQDGTAALRTDLAASTGAALVGSIASGAGAVARTVQVKLRDTVSVKDFGAVGDGVANDTAAIQAAINTGSTVYMPQGAYLVTDRVSMQKGQILHGDGRTKSFFKITPAFNMAATGVLRLGGGEPGAEVYDIGFQFQQANQGVRANVTAYPPAIDAVSTPRFILDRIRIEGAFDGINATGNSGGAYIGFLECGTLNKGVVINGSLDFFHGTHWHFWPFGFTVLGTLLDDVYYDGLTKAVEIGLVDGLTLDSISAFRSFVEFTSETRTSPPSLVSTINLDGDGSRLVVSGGVVAVGKIYDTKSPAPTASSIVATAGSLTIGMLITTNSHAGQIVNVSGTATVVVNGGRVQPNNTANSAFVVTGGKLSLNSLEFAINPSVFTAAHVSATGACILQLVGCKWNGKGAGSGNAVFVGTHNSENIITSNIFSDWGYIVPTGYTGGGNYGPNATPMKSWAPVATFATTGNFAPTYVAQVGKYREEAGGIYFEGRLVFSTNAYTTASGAFRISGLPLAKSSTASDSSAVTIGRAAFVTMTAGNAALSGSISNGASSIDILQSGSGIAVTSISVANVPASTSNIELSFSGFLPTY